MGVESANQDYGKNFEIVNESAIACPLTIFESYHYSQVLNKNIYYINFSFLTFGRFLAANEIPFNIYDTGRMVGHRARHKGSDEDPDRCVEKIAVLGAE